MKLPGITYGPVQSLGRQDVGGELQKGAAISGALRQTAAVLGDIYEKQSVTQAEKALLIYDTGMSDWAQNQGPYQEDGSGTWQKGDELYDNANQANRKTATKELQTPMAKAIFDRKAAQYDAQNKVKWGGAQLKWMKEDQAATALKAYDDYKNAREWDKARATIDREVTIGNMSATDGQRKLIQTNYFENYYAHSDAVEGVWNADTGAVTIQNVKDDNRLDDKDKNTLIKATEDKMLQATTDDVFTTMTAVANEAGLPDAIVAGELMFDGLRDTEAEDIGSDENFKLATLNRVNQVINTFKNRLKTNTAVALRTDEMNRVKNGLDPASADINMQQYNDWYATDILGWNLQGGGGQYVRTTGQSEIYNDQQVRADTIGFIAGYGVIPKTADESLQAALQAQRGKDGLNAVMTLHGISQASPEAMFKHGNHDMNAVASMAEMLGGDESAYQIAYDNYLKVRDMDTEMKKTFYNPEEFNKTFDDNFASVLKKQYPVDNPMWAFWRSSAPQVRQDYQNRIKQASKSFLPYTNGDTQSAMRMAMYSMRASFAPSKANGDTPELMENPPELFVPHADYDGGSWLMEQRNQDIQANWGEGYNTEFVKMQPAPYFDKNDPAYIIYDYNPELGFVRQMGIMKYDFNLTPQGAEYLREAEQRARLDAFEMERQRKAIEYEINQDPENKEFYPPSGGKGAFEPTPYGQGERRAGPLEKTAQAFAKGKKFKKLAEEKVKEKRNQLLREMFYPDENAKRPERLPIPGGG